MPLSTRAELNAGTGALAVALPAAAFLAGVALAVVLCAAVLVAMVTWMVLDEPPPLRAEA